ncbi:MAG: DNA polymerase III subunit gamma/tau [Candidatus Pacebacteria bacterium]|nr:DNA polymerase III subunit gamma/tau [Candidatus Paceibacterota bacterium]MCD8508342.1 DNA polymerase III subunit gamma/tau [Candidatus Paceibacterota bacterium]MCD8563615.1 DNA polymerase III subunit gamma/tau [Candidatus Paceibacterota bacterium]
MSFQALYRKYRPQTFADVRGQDHIVSVLEGALAQQSIAHAYLFAGSRGTGKTTLARIFAKALGTHDHDLYEIDAASHRGIDDIRELRSGVGTLPFSSPYKVYIIDEVHMLTKDAFNALLKTLEEPPAHVIFILATTELDKILPTIVSRCQVLHFHKPTHALLQDVVRDIATREGYTLGVGVPEAIALLGDGSFRDTQGMLQKIIAATPGTEITYDALRLVTGIPSQEIIHELITGIAHHDFESITRALQQLTADHADISLSVLFLLQQLRAILLIRFAPQASAYLAQEYTDTDFAFLKKMSTIEGKHINAQAIAHLLEAHAHMRHAAIPVLALELAFMRILGQDM